MKREERISHISNMLKRFVSEDDSTSFLIFRNPALEKEVTFDRLIDGNGAGKKLRCCMVDGIDFSLEPEERNEAK